LPQKGNDKIVLGMPWLRRTNPDIVWIKRTVDVNRRASTVRGSRMEHLAPQIEDLKENKNSTENGGRGGYNVLPESHEEEKYQKNSRKVTERTTRFYRCIL